MLGPFERALAVRYLWGARGRNERRGFLRFVTAVAITGVAVGTAALLVALMTVRGFGREIEAKIVGFGQHVQVESYLGEPLADAGALAARLEGIPQVERVTPAVIDFVLLRAAPIAGEAAVDGVLLWGTEPEGQAFIAENVRAGALAFGPDEQGRPGLVLGGALARSLGLEVGEAVTVFATRGPAGAPGQSRPRVRAFHVAGLFETGLADFDERFAYVALDDARRLAGLGPDEVTRLDLTLTDIADSRAVAAAISEQVGPPVFARSIYDVYSGLFAWVALQRSIVPVVISILVLVAAFNIVGTLLMVVLEKTREIGTVLAMGASRAAVRRLFVFLGFLVGVVGALSGGVLALVFGLVQDRYRLIPLPREAYYLDAAPVELYAPDFVWVIALAVLLCTLAAYLPARAAARIEPIRSIRFGA